VLRIYDCVLSNHVTKDGSCTEGDGNGYMEAELTRRHRALEALTLVVRDDKDNQSSFHQIFPFPKDTAKPTLCPPDFPTSIWNRQVADRRKRQPDVSRRLWTSEGGP